MGGCSLVGSGLEGSDCWADGPRLPPEPGLQAPLTELQRVTALRPPSPASSLLLPQALPVPQLRHPICHSLPSLPPSLCSLLYFSPSSRDSASSSGLWGWRSRGPSLQSAPGLPCPPPGLLLGPAGPAHPGPRRRHCLSPDGGVRGHGWPDMGLPTVPGLLLPLVSPGAGRGLGGGG